MHGHAAGHGHIFVTLHHVPVHILVNQAEYYSLVAHQCLVVALNVGYCLLIGAAVGQLPVYRCRVPVLVLLLLEHLDPVVGDTHGHTVVKSQASVLYRKCQARHAAHLLGYGYGRWIDGVDQLVGKRQVGYGICVLIAVVVVGI